jgi:putative hydrolase of the HAD superfamily
MVSSEEACAEKPSQRIFDRCLEKAGCDSQECLFVGDNLGKDAKGAADAGLVGILYRPEGVNSEINIPVIQNLKEILKLIG